MAKKKEPKSNAKLEATAKAEVTAKAVYQRKRTTTEVIPPDVTRAKAGAWLALISPITEWAGLKGDALRFKRQQLRIQQEDTLLRIAEETRKRLDGQLVSNLVPRKILVPALEKASLEERDDEVMIDRWANLLASAAIDTKVQPRFVGILEELSGKQAECLERLAFNKWTDFNFPSVVFGDSFLDFAEYNIQDRIDRLLKPILTTDKKIEIASNLIVEVFCRPGVSLSFSMISDAKGEVWEVFDSVSRTGIHDESDLSILESLGLVRYVALKSVVGSRGKRFEVDIYYHHLTSVGVEFCEVCSRPRVIEMERKAEDSRTLRKTTDRF